LEKRIKPRGKDCYDELCEKLKEPRQILEDQENTKFGFDLKGNQSDPEDKDVEMSNAEVLLNDNVESSNSNAAGVMRIHGRDRLRGID
jgi:hypothetical protein